MRNSIILPCMVLMCTVAWADAPTDASSAPDRSDRSPAGAVPIAAVDPIRLGEFTVTGTLRARLYVWDWFRPPIGENLYDISIEYRPSRAYFSYTQGLVSMRQIYPEDEDGRFGFIELFYRFQAGVRNTHHKGDDSLS